MRILRLTIAGCIYQIEGREESAQVGATAGLFRLLLFGNIVLDCKVLARFLCALLT